MKIGKRLTLAVDVDKSMWKQAQAADLVAYLKMLSGGKHPASILGMDRFVKKILSRQRTEATEEVNRNISAKSGKEKKSFASFRWRPVDGKTFVIYSKLLSFYRGERERTEQGL